MHYVEYLLFINFLIWLVLILEYFSHTIMDIEIFELALTAIFNREKVINDMHALVSRFESIWVEFFIWIVFIKVIWFSIRVGSYSLIHHLMIIILVHLWILTFYWVKQMWYVVVHSFRWWVIASFLINCVWTFSTPSSHWFIWLFRYLNLKLSYRGLILLLDIRRICHGRS